MKNTILIAVLLLSVTSVSATDRHVPDPYPNIIAAVGDCVDGDVVIISPGTYTGWQNRKIYIWGKAITVRGTDPTDPETVAQTIIDCQGMDYAFSCRLSDAIISGLTIANGSGGLGGAFYCIGGGLQITNCVLSNNSAGQGGALWCAGGAPEIRNCIIKDNSASLHGGAIYCGSNSNPTISNCLVVNNAAPNGSCIYGSSTNAAIHNCTFSGNGSSGSSIYCTSTSNMLVKNSILWADTSGNGQESFLTKLAGLSSLTISHCDVRGGVSAVSVDTGSTLNWNAGNLNGDPMFVAGPFGDCYLEPTSPCVDAGGDLASKLDLDKLTTQTNGQPDSGLVDMGHHYPSNATTIPAIIDIKPDTLNISSQGRWINCYIWLPDGYNVADIDAGSIFLDGKIPSVGLCIDEEGQVAVAKFPRAAVQGMVEPGSVELIVTGGLMDGTTMFQGSDVLRVMGQYGNGNKNAMPPLAARPRR